MKHLLTIREQDVYPDAPIIDTSQFRRRTAARAVVLDPDGGVYLLNVGKHHYHKLPGGGVDEGEDIKAGLARKLLEEIGIKAEVISELGQVIEYRDQFKLIQTSFCYLARQVGEQVEAAPEDDEIDDQQVEDKARDIDHAIQMLEADTTEDYEGPFILRRDLALLKEAKRILQRKE